MSPRRLARDETWADDWAAAIKEARAQAGGNGLDPDADMEMADGRPAESLKEHHQSLTQLVADRIRDAILAREFPPGARITEATLASRWGVSKTPVRESLLRLQYIGVMEPDGPRGGRIVAASQKAIADAYHVREALESQAARLAAANATDRILACIESSTELSMKAANAGKVEEFRKWDRRFHSAVALGALNERLSEMIRDSLLLTWTLRRRDVPLADDSPYCAKQHEQITEAISSKRAKPAGEAMATHIAHVREVLMAAYPAEEE